MSEKIIDIKGLNKSFRSADGSDRVVLENVDFELKTGEVVALLGQSGSGKSTLLRMIAGLIMPDKGHVLYNNKPLYGPAEGISMVFQSFALFPWLTVQKNVQIGLEARGAAPAEQAERAREAINLIGLEGFENALPRELSGGMRQRVGIARALVLQPEVLLMDEAFSALDVMTGENLRDDILELWQSGKLPIKSLLVVSHNIEEAVVMADRVMLFSSNPGRVQAEMKVTFSRPRQAKSGDVQALVDTIYGKMIRGRRNNQGQQALGEHKLTDRLPAVGMSEVEGVIERLARPPFGGRADLSHLAEASELNDETFLDLVDALVMFSFAEVKEDDILLSPMGEQFAQADGVLRRRIIGQQALARIPLVAHICHSLHQNAGQAIGYKDFKSLLSFALDKKTADATLQHAIEWARYGDLIDIDFSEKKVFLPLDS